MTPIPKPTPEDMSEDLASQLKWAERKGEPDAAFKRALFAEAKLREALLYLKMANKDLEDSGSRCYSCASKREHYPDCKFVALITELEAVYGKAE